MLPPQHRLRHSDDFRQTIRRGKRAGGRYVVAHVLMKSTRPTRVGFVVSKAIGNAVTRNQVKRRMRAASVQFLSGEVPRDIVFRALPRAAEATYQELDGDMVRCVAKIGDRR